MIGFLVAQTQCFIERIELDLPSLTDEASDSDRLSHSPRSSEPVMGNLSPNGLEDSEDPVSHPHDKMPPGLALVGFLTCLASGFLPEYCRSSAAVIPP